MHMYDKQTNMYCVLNRENQTSVDFQIQLCKGNIQGIL